MTVVLKLLKWLLFAVIVLVGCIVIALAVGQQLALDREAHHTRATDELPLYSPSGPDGIVRLAAGGLEFRTRIAGCGSDAGGARKPAVILLHGFPVNSAMWLPLIEPLISAGFCVVAPDQRGYSPGARPPTVDDYTVDRLSGDVIAIADALGLDTFHLVGHDWGSIVGWTTAMRSPWRVTSWTGLSVPHPTAFGRAVQEDPDQRSRSGYFLLFATPWLPEALFAFNDFYALRGAYVGRPDAQREEFLRLFAEPGAMTAALNWYRAMGRASAADGEVPDKVSTPTLFIWGNGDVAIGRRGVELQRDYMIGPYTEIELNAGHWLLVEEPERVITLVTNHLRTHARLNRPVARIKNSATEPAN